MFRGKGFTLVELIMIIVVLLTISLVAVPRYIRIQKDVREAAAREFVGDLNAGLTLHVADHYLHGTEWVKTGEEAMALLDEGRAMPEGMTYAEGEWSTEGSSTVWRFEKAAGGLPPRVVKVGGRDPDSSGARGRRDDATG